MIINPSPSNGPLVKWLRPPSLLIEWGIFCVCNKVYEINIILNSLLDVDKIKCVELIG